jgi:biopolymer transport protein ExbB
LLQTIKTLALLGGDWVLFFLIFLSIWCAGVILERLWVFRGLGSGPREGLEALLRAGKFPELLKGLEKDLSPEASVLKSGLSQKGLDREGLRENFESARIGVKLELEKNLLILGTLGSNAPFIGLFGTVLGIIRAFNDLALQGTAGSTVVMRGISEALVATALGLLIAIPAVVFYNYFQGRIKKCLSNSERLCRLALARVPAGKK